MGFRVAPRGRMTTEEIGQIRVYPPGESLLRRGYNTRLANVLATQFLERRYNSLEIAAAAPRADPQAHFEDNSCRVFHLNNLKLALKEAREHALQEAMLWVKEKYGVEGWERDAFGGYQVKGTLEKVQEVLETEKTLV